MFELGGFRLRQTGLAHAWMYVWMGITSSVVLSIWPNWSSSLLFIFLFFQAKKKIHQTPSLHQHGTKRSSGALTPRTMSAFWEMRASTVGVGGQERGEGWCGSPFHTCPWLLTHPSLLSDTFILLGSSWQDRMLLGRGVGEDNAPTRSFKQFSQLSGHELSLRRCCWRSWMWKPWPCLSCPRRPQTSGCEAWGTGHWPAGAHQCGPPYGRLDSAL